MVIYIIKKLKHTESEADIIFEVNPYVGRVLVNTEILVLLNLQLIEKIIKLSRNEKITSEELAEVSKLKDEFNNLINSRTFANEKDLEFLKTKINIL